MAPPSQQFAARENGATAGVTTQNGQAVFASSTAQKAKKAASSGAGSASPSERTAVGDAWSGFSSGASAGGSATPAAASLSEGGSGSTLGLAILGLGLVGMLGTFLVLATPRLRRAATVRRQGARRKERGPSGQ